VYTGPDIDELPEDIPETVTEITIQSTSISSIASRAFFKFLQLIKLDLSKNEIVTVAADAFVGTRITNLDLSVNNLATLPYLSAISSTLVELNVENNQLTSIGANDFRGFEKLQRLHLSDNQLHTIAEGAFSMRVIVDLHLEGNRLITRLIFVHCDNSGYTSHPSQSFRIFPI
jgi:Leucine-rich repeat (LRR) protein